MRHSMFALLVLLACGKGQPPVVSLASLALTPLGPTVAKGSSQQFVATGRFSDGSAKDLTSQVDWSSSDIAIATVAGGLATGKAVGAVTIIARSGAVSAASLMTVGNAALLSMVLDPASASIPHGTFTQFTATGAFTDGTRDVTAGAAWTSDNSGVATVTGGMATGAGIGSTTIRASIGDVSASAVVIVTSVVVTPPALVSIEVTPANPVLTRGDAQELGAMGTFSDGSNRDLTAAVAWASSDESIGTVAPDGLATAAGDGQATITARSGNVVGSTLLTSSLIGSSWTRRSIPGGPPTTSLRAVAWSGALFVAVGESG